MVVSEIHFNSPEGDGLSPHLTLSKMCLYVAQAFPQYSLGITRYLTGVFPGMEGRIVCNWQVPEVDFPIPTDSAQEHPLTRKHWDELFDNVMSQVRDFLDLSELFTAANNLSMNLHDSSHVEVVYKKVRALYDLFSQFSDRSHVLDRLNSEIAELITAVVFHDSGMAVGNRKKHAQVSSKIIRDVFNLGPNPDPHQQRMLKRIVYLARNHTKLSPRRLIHDVKRDPTLALLVLADELHLENRVDPRSNVTSFYENDGWVRIGTDVTSSKIKIVDGKVYWEIVSTPESSPKLKDDIINLVWKPKAKLITACITSLMGVPQSFECLLNHTVIGSYRQDQ